MLNGNTLPDDTQYIVALPIFSPTTDVVDAMLVPVIPPRITTFPLATTIFPSGIVKLPIPVDIPPPATIFPDDTMFEEQSMLPDTSST